MSVGYDVGDDYEYYAKMGDYIYKTPTLYVVNDTQYSSLWFSVTSIDAEVQTLGKYSEDTNTCIKQYLLWKRPTHLRAYVFHPNADVWKNGT